MPAIRLAAAGVVALLVCASGCITLFSKTEYIRDGEARRAVAFETPKAAETFHNAAKKHSARVGGDYVGVPFVTLYSRDRMLAENARFNDAVVRCDTNHDGIITETEAVVFANHVE